MSFVLYYYYYIYNGITEQTQEEKKYVCITKHQNKTEMFNSRINELENMIKYVELNPNRERELYELYYKGVPDIYDHDGNIIHGVEPDVKKAIQHLNALINSPYKIDKDVLNLARIYHYGMHKFDPEIDMAENIYNDLKFESTTTETQLIIKDALDDIHRIRVHKWLNIPLEKPPERLQENTVHVTPVVTRREARQVVPQPVRTENVHKDKKYNDPQNTHNPQVLSTIRFTLDKLKKSTNIMSDESMTKKEIEEYLENIKDSDKKYDALKSLRAVENSKDSLSSTGMREMEALVLVWNRIKDNSRFGEEVSNNLKETLMDELASMQEHGNTICSTGRFTHVIDTLNGVDEEVVIKPTYAINEEMMTKSAKIRENMLNEKSENERKKLEEGTSSDQDDFDKKLKETIINNLKDDYVKTGILSTTNFDLEVNKWIDHI